MDLQRSISEFGTEDWGEDSKCSFQLCLVLFSLSGLMLTHLKSETLSELKPTDLYVPTTSPHEEEAPPKKQKYKRKKKIPSHSRRIEGRIEPMDENKEVLTGMYDGIQ